MSLLDDLLVLGIDVDAAVKHFKGNTAMYERLIKKFPESVKGRDVLPHLESGDIKQAYEQAHALKGICANLYVNPLYELYAQASAILKTGSTEGVLSLISRAVPLQEQIVNAIESA